MHADLHQQARFVASDQAADLCVILVNYNTAHLLERCLGELRRASAGLAVRVVIVDNASRDGSAEFIRATFPDCILIANSDNVGFGRANNQALQFGDAPYVLLLNADAFVLPDTLVRSLVYMKAHARCGVLGVELVDEAGKSLWSRGRRFPDLWKNFLVETGLHGRGAVIVPSDVRVEGEAHAWHCDWVVGCYYLVRREVIQQIGLFDPRYFLYFEEVDHCRAVHAAGWSVDCLDDVKVIHVGGGSAETEGELSASGRQISALQTESELLYFRKHDGLVGVAGVVGLSLLADTVRSVKWVVKRRPLAGLVAFWRHSATVCRLALRTRLGSQATR
jgi:GT2 family glycosyltransferase